MDRMRHRLPRRPYASLLAGIAILWVSYASVAWADGSDGGAAEQTTGQGDWAFRVAPYIWLPAMTGDVTVRGTESEIDTSVSDIFTESDFAFALQGQVEAWY